MKRAISILFFSCLWSALPGQEKEAVFKISSVIHPIVAELEPPNSRPEFLKGVMAISSASEDASDHVKQGISQLNSSWDFEAYRHFVEAAKKDPDCLMAYWGIVMSLAGSEHEFFEQRSAALDRMLDLLESNDGEGVGTDIEKGYAKAAGLLIAEGVRTAGETFKAISEKFPNDVQSALFYQFFLRDGFDGFGKPRAGQVKARAGLAALLKKHPEDLAVMAFWVNSQSEGPAATDFLRGSVLPVARKLVEKIPDHPPYYLMLTHLESRCGNVARAIESCEKAIKLYADYLVEDKVSLFDCEGLIRAQVYLASLHENRGQHEAAMKIAKELSKIEISESRLYSRGAGMLLWEARTLGGRLAMSQTTRAGLEAGQESLKALAKEQWYPDQSLAIHYRDALGIYLGIRVALVAKKQDSAMAADSLFNELTKRLTAIQQQRELASKTSTFANWLRATSTLGTAAAELRALIAQEQDGASKLLAVNWFKAAIDRQSQPANLLPPSIIYPVEMRLGKFYLDTQKPAEAAQTYRDGLRLRPGHLTTMRGFHKALIELDEKKLADEVARQIKMIESP